MANNGLPPGATLVSGSLPSTADAADSQSSTAAGLPPGATLVSGTVPPPAAAPGTTGVSGFLNKVGEGGAEAAHDIYGVAKSMVPGGSAETGAASTVWNNLPPVELANSVKQTLPLIHAYESARSKGAPISAALTAVNDAAKQHSSNISQITPNVDAFKANPTRETARALIDATAAAASLLVGGEAAAPEAEAAATAAKVAPVAEAAPATEGILTRLTNPFRRLTTPAKEVGAAAAAEPAAQAVRKVAGATPETPVLAGASTAVDKPITDLATKKSAAYKQIDDVVGFDRKAEIQKLKDFNYAIQQPEHAKDIMTLQGQIHDSELRLAVADKKLAAAKIDPKVADSLNTSWEAGKQFKKGLVTATSSDGTVNVNQLLNSAKRLRLDPKYGDRLAQFFGKGDAAAGKPIADSYVSELQAAQKTGVHAMHVQKIHQWIGGLIGTAALGGAYEGAKLLATATP